MYHIFEIISAHKTLEDMTQALASWCLGLVVVRWGANGEHGDNVMLTSGDDVGGCW